MPRLIILLIWTLWSSFYDGALILRSIKFSFMGGIKIFGIHIFVIIIFIIIIILLWNSLASISIPNSYQKYMPHLSYQKSNLSATKYSSIGPKFILQTSLCETEQLSFYALKAHYLLKILITYYSENLEIPRTWYSTYFSTVAF